MFSLYSIWNSTIIYTLKSLSLTQFQAMFVHLYLRKFNPNCAINAALGIIHGPLTIITHIHTNAFRQQHESNVNTHTSTQRQPLIHRLWSAACYHLQRSIVLIFMPKLNFGFVRAFRMHFHFHLHPTIFIMTVLVWCRGGCLALLDFFFYPKVSARSRARHGSFNLLTFMFFLVLVFLHGLKWYSKINPKKNLAKMMSTLFDALEYQKPSWDYVSKRNEQWLCFMPLIQMFWLRFAH